MGDQTKTDLLLIVILLTAGQEDNYLSRELGHIHLIKYLYLSDFEYSKQNNGETFTGIPWTFYHYGPWEKEAFLRIEPALSSINADKKIIESHKYEDDIIRWKCRNDRLLEEFQEKLPIIVSGAIQKFVHQFGSDTLSLLNYVYKTKPMLKAAPNEYLDFSLEVVKSHGDSAIHGSETCEQLSVKQEKKRKAQLAALKNHMRQRIKTKRDKRIKTITPPRYDDVFFEGLKHLDSLAGERIHLGEFSVTFSDEVWKSKARFDPEIS